MISNRTLHYTNTALPNSNAKIGDVSTSNSFWRLFTIALVLFLVVVLASCSAPRKKYKSSPGKQAHINTKTKFSSKKYGVKGSPRVTTSKRVRKGGGRYSVGKPYKIKGRWYKPREQPRYNKVGMASWYGPNFHGRLTANGEVYDQYSLSAAHPTLPLPSYAKVTNLENGNSVIVRVNDRGPFAHGRIIDLSARASELLDYQKKGIAKVRVKYVGKARMDGRDERYLLASYRPKGRKGPAIAPGATRAGTLLASGNIPLPKSSVGNGIQTASAYATQPRYAPIKAASNSTNLPQFVVVPNAPIPLLRPTPLFDGIPMDLTGGTNLASDVTLLPISYLQNHAINSRINSAFGQIRYQYGFAENFKNDNR